jgi:pre-rRNA-processing protein TSR3
MTYLPTIIVRHRRENRKKCSLTPLETRDDCLFFNYPQAVLPDLSSHIVLKIDAPPLSIEDARYGLLILDGTWRLAAAMEKSLPQNAIARSLPGNFRTAYPRRQTECPDPNAGLASIEALYIAYWVLQRPTEGLLDAYYWKNLFFERNPRLLQPIA